MKPSRWIAVCAGGALVGCADAGGSESDRAGAALKGEHATLTISVEPGGSCALACFHVQSSKDVGFIAVDAAGCSELPVELSLYALSETGEQAAVSIAPRPHGNGKSCANIPAAALKLDELSGKHLIVCAAGAQSAGVFVKSGKTCAARSFEIGAAEQCNPESPGWEREHESSVELAVDPSGNPIFASEDAVTKLDAAGEVRWTFPHGGRVASDADGNLIVAGGADAQLSVSKLDRGGHPIWTQSLAAPDGAAVRSVAVDTGGRIAIAISGAGTLLLDPDGEQLWSKPFSGALAFDALGNLAVSGSFTGTLDVGNGLVESTGGQDAFVVKLGPDGSHAWSQFFGDLTASSQVGTAVAFDQQGQLLIVGELHGSIRLFETDYVLPESTESSNKGAYIAKLDAAGNPLWAQVRSHVEDMLDVATDSADNVYVTGGVAGNVSPFRYRFVEMLDPNGSSLWSLGSSTPEWLGRGERIALDACDNLFWSYWWSEIVPGGLRSDHHVLAKIAR